MKKILILILIANSAQNSYSQNLPSLVLNRNINATFSIIAFDQKNQEWGIAVATNNIYVGNSTIYIQPGIGAFSVIAETDPLYATNGFEQLKKGASIQEAIEATRKTDDEQYYRQVSGIDAKGNVYAFTGDALKYWKGSSTHKTGNGYAVMGNQLAPAVLDRMAQTFEKSTGTLAERLLSSLIAGQQAGGQINGKQSAALVVKGTGNEWYNQIDLRVDHSKTPFEDLQQLLNYHYGRIRLNQAINALKDKNVARGDSLLQQSTTLVRNWYGIYSKLAVAWLLAGKEDKAVTLILDAIKANPQWIENLPAFWLLYHHKALSKLKPEKEFSNKDWNSAIQLLFQLNRNEEAVQLAKKVLQQFPSSSYTWYLLGKAQLQCHDTTVAQKSLTESIRLDESNAEAAALLKQLHP